MPKSLSRGRSTSRFVVGLLLAASMPLCAHAAEPARPDVVFHTSDVDDEHNYGDAQGTLRLAIGSDGTLSGYFRGVDESRLIDVHGAVTGSKFYLSIGDRPIITGSYKDGAFDGYTLEGDRVHHFTAEPAAAERI